MHQWRESFAPSRADHDVRSSYNVVMSRFARGKRHDHRAVLLARDNGGVSLPQARTLGTAARAALARTGAMSVDVVRYWAGGVVTQL
jgi:hypothetical protein